MTKRRASIRGRESEILFGEPAAAGREADEGQDTGSETGDLHDEELDRALYEEARHGAPLPAGVPAQKLPWEDAVLSSPEVEAAMLEEAFAAEEPPERTAGGQVPAWDGPSAGAQGDDSPQYEPPSAEGDDEPASVLPPRSQRPLVEPYQDLPSARDIQEPESEVKPYEVPVRGVSEQERQAILKWWGDQRIAGMSSDIDAAYEQVREKVGENESLTTEAYNQLLKARDILIRRDAERLAQAEYYIEQVRVRLRRAAESETAAKKSQWPLMFWGMFWGIAFLAGLILVGMDRFQELLPAAVQEQSLVQLDLFLSAMLWGGIGGAVAVLYSLFKHIGMRDFDRHYVISYVGKPFMGLIVGATAYMIVALVVRALGISPGAAQPVGELEPAPPIAPGVIYLVAWAAGFKENRLLALVDRLMKQIFGSSSKEEPAAPAATRPAA